MGLHVYHYEVEAERIQRNHCPRCNSSLRWYPENGVYHCTGSACSLIFLTLDFHQEAGWAVVRGVKDKPSVDPVSA